MCPHCDPHKLQNIEGDFYLYNFDGEWFIVNCDDHAKVKFCPICGRNLEENKNV